jgi:hypothetical protein
MPACGRGCGGVGGRVCVDAAWVWRCSGNSAGVVVAVCVWMRRGCGVIPVSLRRAATGCGRVRLGAAWVWRCRGKSAGSSGKTSLSDNKTDIRNC